MWLQASNLRHGRMTPELTDSADETAPSAGPRLVVFLRAQQPCARTRAMRELSGRVARSRQPRPQTGGASKELPATPETVPRRAELADRLPAAAVFADLSPVVGIWSILQRTTLVNRACADPDDLISAVRQGLRRLQYRSDVLDGCLAGIGLVRARP
ncbi:hypothetical protein GCM10027072_75230 [Streptomyces bullii]